MITKQNLENVCARINKLTGNPTDAYSDGKWNIGAYLIDYAYGGAELQRVDNEHGGTTNPLSIGSKKKRNFMI